MGKSKGFFAILGEVIVESLEKEAAKQREIKELTARLSELTGNKPVVVAPNPVVNFYYSFSAGDVVVLRSGGMPPMTVIEKELGSKTCVVQWYDNGLHTQEMPVAALGRPYPM